MKKTKLLVSIMIVALMVSIIPVNYTAEAAASYATEYDSLPANIKSNCVAFARYKVPSLPGGLYSLDDKKAIINNYTPKVGVIAITKGNSQYGHVAYVEAVNGNQITTLNGGWENGTHIGRYTGTPAQQGVIGYWYPSNIAPSNPNPPQASVTFADFSQNGVWETNAEMYIKIMNPNRRRVSAAGCYLYNADGGLVKSYSESCSYTTSYVNYNCNINNDMKYTLSPGTTYLFELYAIVDGKEYKDTRRSFTTKGNSDKERPVISDVSVYDVTETGYKVKCKATDNVGVVKVQFPTWTTANGQDDIQPNWGTNSTASGVLSNGYWIFEVKSWEHNNELGEYITHIYAYDQAGNATCVAAPTTILKKNVVITPTPTPTPTKAPTQAPTATPNNQTDNNGTSSSAYFTEYNLYMVTDDNAEINIKIQNPNREKITSIGCMIYDENDVLLKSYTEKCNWDTSYVNYGCNFKENMRYMLSEGTTYKIVLHAIVGGKEIRDKVRTFTTTGTKNENMEQGWDSSEKETNIPIVTPTPKPVATPKPTSVKKPSKVTGLLVSSSSKSIRASWNYGDIYTRTGFQVQYARNSSFTKNCKTKTVGRFTTNIKISKLKKKNIYYVRVRGINRVGGIIQYGNWCKGKKVKIK